MSAEYKDGEPFPGCNEIIATIKSEQNERVVHPNYYILPNGIECWDVTQYFNFNIGSAIKYCWRNGRKTEEGLSARQKQIEDLKKARECIDHEIQMLEDYD